MSLVPAWVEAADGKFYANPVIQGPGWFVCFDDEDPPELVITPKNAFPPARALEKSGLKFSHLRAGHGGSYRQFSTGCKMAWSYFFKLEAPIPVPEVHNGIGPGPGHMVEGVYITFGGKK